MTPEEIKAARESKEAQESQNLENNQKESPLEQQVAAMAETVNQLVALSKLDSETKQKEAEQQALLKDQKEKQELEENADFQKLLSASEKKEEKGFDDLTNNELLDVIANAFNSTIDARMKTVNSGLDDKLKTIVDSGKTTKNAVLSMIAQTNVDRTINGHEDFEQFRDGTKSVMTQYPGIEIEDAYILAKAKEVAKLPPKIELETERPDSTMAPLNTSKFESRENKGHQSDRGNEYAGGQHGLSDFRQFAAAGIKRALAGRKTI